MNFLHRVITWNQRVTEQQYISHKLMLQLGFVSIISFLKRLTNLVRKIQINHLFLKDVFNENVGSLLNCNSLVLVGLQTTFFEWGLFLVQLFIQTQRLSIL